MRQTVGERLFEEGEVLIVFLIETFLLDNLAGHKSYSLVQWCAEHSILLLWTPTSGGSWLNMAESVQRIIKGRALNGQHSPNVQTLKQWLTEAVEGWNRHPTPFIYGGKRYPPRSCLCSTRPSGRIWSHYHLCRSSTYPLRSLLPQGGLMPSDLATDPLEMGGHNEFKYSGYDNGSYSSIRTNIAAGIELTREFAGIAELQRRTLHNS